MKQEVKEFIKKVNSDEESRKAFMAMLPEDQTKIDRDAFIEEKILPFAKERGYDLSVADFEPEEPASGEISDDELTAVAGGMCICPVAGGGEGTDANNNQPYVCGCVAYGQGGQGFEDANCLCPLYGTGADAYDIF